MIVVSGIDAVVRLRAPACPPAGSGSEETRLTGGVQLSHTLRRWRAGSLHDFDRYAVLRTYARGTATWVVRCPKPGLYALSITAALDSGATGPPVCVYRFLVDCQRPVVDARPMPRTTARWRHCRLVEPLDGELVAGSTVKFALESTEAVELVVNTAAATVSNSSKNITNTSTTAVSGIGFVVFL